MPQGGDSKRPHSLSFFAIAFQVRCCIPRRPLSEGACEANGLGIGHQAVRANLDDHYQPVEGVSVTPTVNSASIIDLRAYVDPSVVPTLVLVDLQKEYIAAPRVLALPHAPQALANCRIALTHARTKGFPVAFVRWLGRSALFNRATPFSGWIEGFEPTGADMVFEPSFGEVMSDSGSSFVLAGFAGESACLATAIDAFHRGHRITYLDNASASHTLDEIGAPDVHRVVSKVLGLYAQVVPTQFWVAATSRTRA
jgi:hypothetical protein